jgi:putative tricarboxylic transport membrane protein
MVVLKAVDRITAVLLILCGIIGYFHSESFPRGAEIFPQLVFLFITLLAMRLLMASFGSYPEGEIFANVDFSRVITAIVFSILYVALIPRLGYVIATPLFLFALMFVMDQRSGPILALVPLGMTGVVFFVFKVLLEVPIPMGILD